MSAVIENLSPEIIEENQASEATSSGINFRNKLVYAGKMHWVHWTVIALSLLLTFGAWYISNEQVSKRAEERFQREAEQVVELVKERLTLYENALSGAVSLIDSNHGRVTYDQWFDYSNSLRIDKTYPGINGIGVIFNIQPNQMEDYLAAERDWRPDYKVHPQHAESEYWPITYIEPVAANKKAIGLDMAFETNRYSGIKKSRDTGMSQLTGPITLVQDAKKTPGFLFYSPFYKNGIKPDTVDDRRKNIVGVTYAPFIMYKLMQGTLATENRHVSISINDAGELLYNDSGASADDDIDPSPQFSKKVAVELYGRNWNFDIASNLSFRQSSANSQPLFILAGGIVIDSLLLGLFIFLSRANRKALSYADQMTDELQIKTRHLEKSNQDLEQFAYVASHDLKSPLNAIKNLVTWIEEDIENNVPENSKNNLLLLRGRSDRMSKLLDDLLDYSRIGQLSGDCQSIQLKPLIERIFEMQDNAENFTLNVEDIELNIPRIPFEIVVRNLISNVIKHHDKNTGVIELTAQVKDAYYQIRIQDDGPGIPADMHAKALEMFQTLRSRDEVEGSGMGLTLANKIVQQYGGELVIDSGGIRGTGIIVSWPIPS